MTLHLNEENGKAANNHPCFRRADDEDLGMSQTSHALHFSPSGRSGFDIYHMTTSRSVLLAHNNDPDDRSVV